MSRLRRRWGKKPHEEGIHEVNMTPLIDVSLVLVVILLVATPMAFQSGIAVRHASASARAARQEVRAERIEITILSNQEVRLNRDLFPIEPLEVALRPLLDASPTRQVVVRCMDGVSHGAFVNVIDQARLCGAAIAVVSP